jgi:exopolysaccharide biosynthesis polyprenyl glycosylphosphotransferase
MDGKSTLLLDEFELGNELRFIIDQKTLDILDRRRRTSVVKRRGWLVRRMLLLADLTGLVLAMLITEFVVTLRGPAPDSVDSEIAVFLVALPLWIVVAKIYGLYDRDEEVMDHSGIDEFTGVFHMIIVCTWFFWLGAYLTGLGNPLPSKLFTFSALAVVTVVSGRAVARSVCRRRINYIQNTVIVGAGKVGQLVAKKLLSHPEYGLNLVGFVDAEPLERSGVSEDVPILGGPERLPALIGLFDLERVIIAFSKASQVETLDLIRSLKDFDVQVDIVPRFFELVGAGYGIHAVEGMSLVGLPPARLSRSSRLLKQILDIVIAAVALLLLLPLFAIIAVITKLDSPGPVFFRQVRMGSNEETFRIWKFRSMVADADVRKADVIHLNQHALAGEDSRMFKAANDPRVTEVGSFLRRTSLDELPQLINVLCGQMSLVGPRPLILDENKHVVDWGRTRLRLKPGITGLWQVLGRSEIPFEEMTRLDYLYVMNWSLWGDVVLIFRTLPALLRTRNAY